MPDTILNKEPVDRKLPVPTPGMMAVVALLWLTFACVLPLHQVGNARRQARLELQNVLASARPDNAGVMAAFERSNQYLDAAASGPCLLLAATIIFLLRQMHKLRRRYNEAVSDLVAQRSHGEQSPVEVSD